MATSASIAGQPRESVRRRLLDVGEAGLHLGVSARTVWQMTAAGDLPAARLGPRSTRWDVRDLDAFIDDVKTVA